MSVVSKFEVVAVAAVKKFREMILAYEGPSDFQKFKDHLLRQLARMEVKGDEILADIIDEIL